MQKRKEADPSAEAARTMNASSRLIIYNDRAAAVSTRPGVLARFFRMLLAGRKLAHAPVRVTVCESGRACVFEVDDAGPLLDIELPAGTYQVTAEIDGVLRTYTLTLQRGTSSSLHLRMKH